MGFEPLAYKGLETGCRKYAAHAVKQNKVSTCVLINWTFITVAYPEEDFSKPLIYIAKLL